MNDQIPAVNIELIEDGLEKGLIVLETCHDWERMKIKIHPLHVRYLAEKIGLINSNDQQRLKTVEALRRKLFKLRDRAIELSEHLGDCSLNDKAVIDTCWHYAVASADIAAEFCAELEDKTAAGDYLLVRDLADVANPMRLEV